MRQAATLLLIVTLAACGQEQPSASTATGTSTPPPAAATAAALTPEQLGSLGAQIRKEPARADELLAQHRLTRESFEKAIRDVTENADASRRYAAAYMSAGK